jgi:hypothetical protein
MGSVADFHVALYGKNVCKECHQLYSAFEEMGCRGVASRDLVLARFQAAVVLALFEVNASKSKEFVYLVVPKAHEPWALVKLATLAGEAFKLRKKDKESILAVKNAFARLKIGTKPLHLKPDVRWVAFGFSKTDPVPSWMASKLAEPV